MDAREMLREALVGLRLESWPLIDSHPGSRHVRFRSGDLSRVFVVEIASPHERPAMLRDPVSGEFTLVGWGDMILQTGDLSEAAELVVAFQMVHDDVAAVAA